MPKAKPTAELSPFGAETAELNSECGQSWKQLTAFPSSHGVTEVKFPWKSSLLLFDLCVATATPSCLPVKTPWFQSFHFFSVCSRTVTVPLCVHLT